MLLPWHKAKETIVYVPIHSTDNRPYIKKWEDKEYIQSVRELEYNTVFITEVMEALKKVRDAADRAETPQELKGCNIGITALKGLLTVSRMARDALENMKAYENLEKENDGSASR